MVLVINVVFKTLFFVKHQFVDFNDYLNLYI